MCDLTLEFWRKVLHAPITNFTATPIKEGYLPSTVYHVQLESLDSLTPRSVILKCVRPPWGEDADRRQREYCVYAELVSRMPIPQAARYFMQLADEHSSRAADSHTHIVMRDLSDEYVFYPETHAWTWTEAQAILRALARMHRAGESLRVSERPYLMSRLCTRWTPTRVREMFSDLLNTSWLRARMERAVACVDPVLNELPHLEKIAAHKPLTLVHYDIYPPNVAFARNAAQPDAVLIDWAGATADIGEIDLAFLFQQPYKSDRLLDWRAALRFYCDERARVTGCAYDWGERCAIFRYARIQALFTAFLAIHRAWEKCRHTDIRIASDSPEPYMRFYDATLNVILDNLQELAEEP